MPPALEHVLLHLAVLLVGLVAFVFLLAGTIDEAWVQTSSDSEYTGAGGETKTGTAVGKLGLTTLTSAAPSYLDSISSEFDLKISYPFNIAIGLINDGNKQTDGPTAVSGQNTRSQTRNLQLFRAVQQN